jgi:hypothetical protein
MGGAVPDRQFTEPALAELYDRWEPWPQRGDFGFYLPLVMSAGLCSTSGDRMPLAGASPEIITIRPGGQLVRCGGC